ACSFFFFFSSRRRHTRFSRDWSSDVCSSDLRGIRHQDVLGHPQYHQDIELPGDGVACAERPRRMELGQSGNGEVGRQVGPCGARSEEHTSELQSRENLVCRLLLEKKKKTRKH